jgi:hypothetical protein
VLVRYPYLEQRAEALRLALRLPGGMTTHDVERAVRWGRRWITVDRSCAYREVRWQTDRDGAHFIALPASLPRWQANRALLHELAHPLLHVGMGVVTRDATPEERALHPLTRDRRRYEEELANELDLALRLPGRWTQGMGDVEGIARETGLPYAWIHRRLRTLNGHALDLTWIPYWSAARAFRVERHGGTLLVLDGDTPLCRTGLERRLPLLAALMALRPVEFRAMVRGCRIGEGLSLRPRSMAIDMEELRAWAGWETG